MLGTMGTVGMLGMVGTLGMLRMLGTFGTLGTLGMVGTLGMLGMVGTLGMLGILGTLGTLGMVGTLPVLDAFLPSPGYFWLFSAATTQRRVPSEQLHRCFPGRGHGSGARGCVPAVSPQRIPQQLPAGIQPDGVSRPRHPALLLPLPTSPCHQQTPSPHVPPCSPAPQAAGQGCSATAWADPPPPGQVGGSALHPRISHQHPKPPGAFKTPWEDPSDGGFGRPCALALPFPPELGWGELRLLPGGDQ